MMIELSETALFRQGILAQEPFGNTTGWFGAMCRAVHFKNLGLHRTRTNKTEKISNQLAPSDAWIPGSGDY